jgi:hypothetical protein
MVIYGFHAKLRRNYCINNHMELTQLKALIKVKSKEFEQAMEEGKPPSELLPIYKEIKRIAYEITQKENKVELIPDRV